MYVSLKEQTLNGRQVQPGDHVPEVAELESPRHIDNLVKYRFVRPMSNDELVAWKQGQQKEVAQDAAAPEQAVPKQDAPAPIQDQGGRRLKRGRQ